jgi:hemerythrin-like metal-binding protein
MTAPLATSLETLNQDHAELFLILQAAKNSLQRNERLADVGTAIMEAFSLFRLHSAKEEMLMQMAAFPEAAAANADHLRLDTMFEALMTSIEAGNSGEVETALRDLIRNLVVHVREHDRKYADYIASRMDVPHIPPHLLRD